MPALDRRRALPPACCPRGALRSALTAWALLLLLLCAASLSCGVVEAAPRKASGKADSGGSSAGTGTEAGKRKGEPQIVMGPFLRDLTLTEVTVVFRTNVKVQAAVLYRVPGEEDVRLDDAAPTIHHEFTLKLLPDRVYAYRVLLGDREIPGGSFITPPGPKTPVIIGVYGDTRKYDEPHAAVCAALVRRSVDLLIHTGDLVHDGYLASDWLRFFQIEHDLLSSTPVYAVIGNHDNRGKLGTWWFETLFGKGSKYRSIDYGPVHLVILNSEGGLAEQARWLEEDLARLRREKPNIHYVLAFIHHGPYGTGRFNGNRRVAALIAPLLRRYGPSIIFSGHEHDYERGEVDGLPFYVTGGGGAILEGRRCPGGKCPSWSKIWLRIYHYLIIEAAPSGLRICTYHPNGLEVEPCIDYPAPPPREPAADAAASSSAGSTTTAKAAVVDPPSAAEPSPEGKESPPEAEGADERGKQDDWAEEEEEEEEED